ncbi:MAG: ABC transporter permease [Propionibacteriaceae bacterium]|uniref:ABC-2 family transporter protein n=1 Tax=Propionibacterium ruminifibrarum TaxID=1962131 RepID=A0A375I3D3_9ACTN|nr:ABC transporter permease [Propionibacterium ruminifibrarum]MBE6477561.1 ABC transporter permease [Propionibacteriaceae bacterium]SPF69356.1 ABC-2 family transporter protein [Propionibacterium ruminifibrarum]
MNTKNLWLTVAGHEMSVKLRDRGFIISTVLMLAVIAGALGFAAWQNTREQTFTVVTTDTVSAQVAEAIEPVARANGSDARVEHVQASDEGEARARLADDDDAAWLHRTESGWVLTFGGSSDSQLLSYTSTAVSQGALTEIATQAGLSGEQLAAAMNVTSEELDPNAGFTMRGYMVGLTFSVLFMVSSLLFGMQIAQSVTGEKQSRVIEILAAAVPTHQLLLGKIAGNTLMALAQMALYLAVGLIGLSQTDLGSFLPGLSGSIVWFLGFFLVGFLALACLWAAAGALASSQEDLQHTSQPLTWLLMAVYVVGFAVHGQAQTVLSFVPIVSCVLMPARLATSGVPWWQAVIALAITLAFVPLAIWIGSMIYNRSLLQTHGRVSLKQALGRQAA